MRETVDEKRKRARRIIIALEKAYPDAKCALDFATPLELLVATILAAQCTDERVNLVTASLFKRYRTAADYASASPKTFEREIQSTGFFRAKTRSVLGMANSLLERHRGEVPKTRDELVALPGVGLKTASVVLGNAFGQPAIAVDTHVFRVTQRLGLAKAEDPDRLHDQLVEVIPKRGWTRFCHLIQAHGRRTCTARKPACPVCPVRARCPWPHKTRAGDLGGPPRSSALVGSGGRSPRSNGSTSTRR